MIVATILTEWTSLTRDRLRQVASADDPGAAFLGMRPDVFFAMNGRVWPHTERLRVPHVDGSHKASKGDAHDAGHDAGAGMTGMVLGITIDDPENSTGAWEAGAAAARKITLEMKADPKGYRDGPSFGFALADAAGESHVSRVPGPTLVLVRGEPVQITLVL